MSAAQLRLEFCGAEPIELNRVELVLVATRTGYKAARGKTAGAVRQQLSVMGNPTRAPDNAPMVSCWVPYESLNLSQRLRW